MCEIRIRGELDQARSAWFDNMTVIRTRQGETILYGPAVDDAALWGILAKVRDLGLPLVSVKWCPEIKESVRGEPCSDGS